MSEINNAQVDNAKNIDVVMHIYNLIEHRDIYLKTSGSLWQYYRDQPTLKVTSATKLFFVIKQHLMCN